VVQYRVRKDGEESHIPFVTVPELLLIENEYDPATDL
jgi:hypothetical protein